MAANLSSAASAAAAASSFFLFFFQFLGFGLFIGLCLGLSPGFADDRLEESLIRASGGFFKLLEASFNRGEA